jgi:hypothetical protein
MLNQRSFRNWRLATLAEIKAVANAHEKTLCFCDETQTLYRYDPTSGAVADDQYVLTTGAGGTTRWLGIAGQYAYPFGDRSGFPQKGADSTISRVDGTRTFTVQPAVSSFQFFISGVPFTKNAAQNKVWSVAEGIHFFYFDAAGVLQETTSFTEALILSYALVAILYWDATNNASILFCDERHGVGMAPDTHLHMHLSFGCQWKNGLALQGIIADGGGGLNTHAQFGVQDGAVRDEDLEFSIVDGSPQTLANPAQIPVIWRTGASGVYRKKTADTFPLIYSGDGSGYVGANNRIPYNQWTGATWQLTEAANNDLVLVHYWGTNNVDEPVIAILGQDTYLNITDARNNGPREIRNLILAGLPTPEFRPIGSAIFQTNSGYANTPKAQIRSTGTGDDYLDYRSPYNFQQ